jgi:hypothetical protein
MAIAAQIFTLAGVALGAMASFVTTSLNERSRTRREQALRWRDRRIDAYSTYVNDIKDMSAVARRVGASRGLAGRLSDLSAEEGGAPARRSRNAAQSFLGTRYSHRWPRNGRGAPPSQPDCLGPGICCPRIG